MRTFIFLILLALFLSGCGTWNVAPQPFPVWTPIPSRTPSIFTPTPVVLIPSLTATAAISTVTPVPPPTDTLVPSLPPVTDTASPTFTPVPVTAMQIEIIGCNTGFDFTHGMGEVTNAYVILKNTGTMDLPNACGLLRAADEDREHPDKKACVPNLPVNYKVTLKLTVDSAYKQDTIIQVDGLSNDTVLLRIDKQSCTSLDVLGIGVPGDVGVVKPITP